MKIIPSEFSNSAWDYFVLSKKIAFNNFQQNVDSENLLLAIIKEDSIAKEILKKNDVDIKKTEKKLYYFLRSKANMKNKQKILYIGESLNNIFFKIK